MDNIIHGLSNEQYHHGETEREYISSSLLKIYAKSPRAAKYAMEHPQEETDAMRFGSLFHDLMAYLAESKGDWQRGYAEWLHGLARFDPPKNPKTNDYYGATTKAYAEAYQKFLADNEGKTIVKTTDSDLASDMAYALLNNCGATSEQVRKLLKWAKAVEVSYFYETEDGIKLKVRPDLLTRDKLIDWKTCSLDTLDEENIARQIIKYRYDVSLSMYQYVLHEITGKWYKPYLVFVTKSEPYDAMIADISEWCYRYEPEIDFTSIGVGAMEFKRLLDLHTQCVKNNEWPGAESALPEENNAIMKPEVPYYFGKKYFEI